MSFADSSEIVADFVLGFLSDQDDGRVRTLEDYLALYPGHDSVIRAEYAKLCTLAGAARESATQPMAPSLTPQRRRIGSYRIESEIGRGGQGAVYLATDEKLGRQVALKVLALHRMDSADAHARFAREAQVLAGLDHPSIAAVYDYGIADGASFIAMRWVPGETLAKKIAAARDLLVPIAFKSDDAVTKTSESAGRKMPSHSRRIPTETLVFFEKIARALGYAHDAGIVHRDIKPHNIMVTPAGEPVLLDFGLARADLDEDHLTRTGDFLGTPAYMAPEQIHGGPAAFDRRADIYSLAVCLYESLTLTRPHEAAGKDALMSAIATIDCPDVRSRDAELSRDVAAVLSHALERNPDRRYRTTAAFADDLLAIIEGRPVSVKPVGALGRLVRRARRNPVISSLIAASVVLVLALVAAAGWIIARRGDVERGRAERLHEAYERRLERAYLNLSEGDPKDAANEFAALAAERAEGSEEAALGRVVAEHWGIDGVDQESIDAWAKAAGHLSPRLERARARALFDLGVAKTAPEKETDDDALTAFARSVFFMWYGEHGREDAFPLAVRELKKACLFADRPRPLYVMSLAHAAAHAKNEEVAREASSLLIRRWPESSFGLYWAGFALMRYDAQSSLEYSDRAIALKVPGTSPLVNRAAALAELRRYDEAEVAYREAITREENPTRRLGIRRTYIELLTRTMRLEDARRELDIVSKETPMGVDTQTCRAHLALVSGDFDGAIEAAKNVLNVRPMSSEALGIEAEALARSGKKSEATAVFEQWKKVSVGATPSEVARTATILTELDRFSEAEAILRGMLEKQPNFGSLWNEIGRVYARQGKNAEAVDAFQKAYRAAPTVTVFGTNVVRSLRSVARFVDAVKAADDVLKKWPDDSQTIVERAWTLYRMRLFDEAVRSIVQAEARHPNDVTIRSNAALIFAGTGLSDLAFAAIERLGGAREPATGRRIDEYLRAAEETKESDAHYRAVRSGAEPRPTNVDEMCALADDADGRGDHAFAKELYDAALAQGSTRTGYGALESRVFAELAGLSVAAGRTNGIVKDVPEADPAKRLAALDRVMAATEKLRAFAEDADEVPKNAGLTAEAIKGLLVFGGVVDLRIPAEVEKKTKILALAEAIHDAMK